MMKVSGKKKTKPDPFIDTVFSWSLDDIENEGLYKDKVKKIPESFQSAQHYFVSYVYPLLEETRAGVHSSMETLHRAPFAEVVGFEEAKPYGTKLYDVKVDYWRNRFSGKEPYKTLPGDLFILADAKPEAVCDLQTVGRSWAFASATIVTGGANEDASTSLYFKVKASKDFEVEDSRTSLFIVFLVNLIPEGRIYKSLHMSRNLKIINEVLCTDSKVQKDFYSEKSNDIWNQSIAESLSSELNESQTGAVLACLEMLKSGEKSAVELIWGPPGTGKTKTMVTLLSILLQMNCRTLICAPTNVAITEVASRLVKMASKAEPDDFCSLGEILLFGNKERLKIGSEIQEIHMDFRVQRLVECLGPVTGWRHCFTSMIGLLEGCVSDYHIFLENEATRETEQQNGHYKKDKECRRGAQVKKGKCKTFVEFLTDRFASTAKPLRYCISLFCTHIGKSYITVENFQNLVSLIRLVNSFGLLLSQDRVDSEVLEELFSHPDVEDVSETLVGNYYELCMMRRDCHLALCSLRESLSQLKLPNIRNEKSLKEFCFQRASLIFCTASSSFKLHRVAMQPLSLVVIDEAAQLKECESTIPLQLPGVKHAVLVGDECQLPATVKSNVSDEAGFARSLFERLSLMNHSKHLLNMQYRMHPSISFFPNSSFYYNLILDAPNVKQRSYKKHYLPGAMFGPYSFINVIGGREEKDEDGRSRKNMVEVAIVSKILQNLYKEWVKSKQRVSIGIISPYAAQVAAIKDRVGEKYNKLDGFVVKVKTVDGFQGGEEDIIIMSTVRSNSHQSLEFISKPQRVNVSITRARHCLWILGNERTLTGSESVWKDLVLDAKIRQCFFNADENKDLAKAILEVKKKFDQFDDLLNADSILFRSARWKVLFSDNFLKSFKKLTPVRLKKSVLNLLLKLSSGWRPKKQNVETISGSSSMILQKFKVEGLYIVCTNDIVTELQYVQVLKIWDILCLEDIPKLANHLDSIFNRYTDNFINLCKEKCLDSDLEVPKSWSLSFEFSQFKDLTISEAQSDLGGDTSDCRSYVENSQVSESLLLMKFFSLSLGLVNHLLSDREGRELDLPFEVTDEEMEIILHRRSSFIVGRSGTGKTTVLTMKLSQKEQWHQLAVQGCHTGESSKVQQSSVATEGKVLRQLFVTVSPKLCFSVKRHVSHFKSFACGGGNPTDSSGSGLIDMVDFDDEEAQFKDIQDSFHDIPPSSYPLVITFQKFLMMLNGSLSNSYFERFLDETATAGHFWSSRSVAFQSFIRTKEVNYERFSSLYWPRFNTQLTKKLDVSRVYIEILSFIKGGLGAIDACDGRLCREDYVQLCEGRGSNLSKQKREAIYDVFQAYERLKMENGEFDRADFVMDLHRRLKLEKYEGDQMEFVYIDEVQDLTMSQIALFKHVCNNVEEGFVFSGDTAQTIARGIDFRFQDIRHLFYKKFVLESRSNSNDERKEKGLISELLQLTQNFRTHAGILKLSQSIVELLYRFFPFSVDVLKPETSLIYGEAPVLLESGENENAIMKIFGINGNIVGFGAQQVILVRDDCARQEISEFVGKHALVLTIVECKSLEFQDVLLYNFFGSSPLKNLWRVIYDYMKEQDLLDSTLPKGFPRFSESKHNILCSELKQLYVAVTRTRQRLWICENVKDLSKPMFDYWKKKCLVQQRQLDDSLAQAMQVASSPEEWKSRGIQLYHEHNYEMATMCFERAGDTYWEGRSKASGLKAIADRLQASNPEEAKSILREAAEIFDAIGKADSAARCFSDLGEYERAARIYLEKCGESELPRAAECFSLAGCYKDAAVVYAKGNFFSECLTVCANGELFETGLEYINYWKQHAFEDCAKASRGEGIDKMEQEFLESCALHYHKLKDNRFMKFVKAFSSIILMRRFLKGLGRLDELLLLEEENGNHVEAANIAQLKGDILLESDFLGKAGKFKEASLHIMLYVFANSLWSSGSKGWPMKQFLQHGELLKQAKSFAMNVEHNIYELVCAESEILLSRQDNLTALKHQMDACQGCKSIRGEMLSARRILDAHLSTRTDKYLWEKELIGDVLRHSKDIISRSQVSIDSLVYYWNVWKENVLQILESVGRVETPEYNNYVELCFTFLGVWRLHHNLNPIYVLLIPDADWVRGLDKRHLKSYGKLLSIDIHQLIPTARSYWSSELLSVGVKVLEKLEALFKFPVKNSDSTFFQCRALTLIYDVARYLLDSTFLMPRYQDTLQKFATFSTREYVAYIFPLDWRNSLRQNMISLRRTAASKNVLNQVIVEYTSSKNDLSYGQIGRIAMIILGSGKLNTELSDMVVKKLDCNTPWNAFIENLCASSGPGNTSQEPIKVSVMWLLHAALVETYSANWRKVPDYISPGCFLYLVERLLFSAGCFQGFVITTSSCFIEWLLYQDEDARRCTVTDGQPSLEDILRFVVDVVHECIFNKDNMREWIKKSDRKWRKYYQPLMLRLVTVLCLVYLNFHGSCINIIHDLLGRNSITEFLPWEFFNALRRRRRRRHKSVTLNVNVLAGALKKIDNTLVIASFGANCSKFFCSDAIFVDMTTNQSMDDILRKLFPQPPVIQLVQSQVGSVESEGTSSCSRVLPTSESDEGKSSKPLVSDALNRAKAHALIQNQRQGVRESDATDKQCLAGDSKDEGDCKSSVLDQHSQGSISEQHDAEDSHTRAEENDASSESNPTSQQDVNTSTPSRSKESRRGTRTRKARRKEQHDAEDSHTKAEENDASSESNLTCDQDVDSSPPSGSKESGSKANNKEKGKNKKGKSSEPLVSEALKGPIANALLIQQLRQGVRETDAADKQCLAGDSHSKDERDCKSNVLDQQSQGSTSDQHDAEDNHAKAEENDASSESNPTCQQDVNNSTPLGSKESGSTSSCSGVLPATDSEEGKSSEPLVSDALERAKAHALIIQNQRQGVRETDAADKQCLAGDSKDEGDCKSSVLDQRSQASISEQHDAEDCHTKAEENDASSESNPTCQQKTCILM